MTVEILDVDLVAYEQGDLLARAAVVDGVRRSLGHGFVYVAHDLSETLVDEAYGMLEEFFALEENRTAAQLLLVSEVASAWLTLIADRELLQLASETRDSQKKSYDLTKLRFEQGVSSEIELRMSLGRMKSGGTPVNNPTSAKCPEA